MGSQRIRHDSATEQQQRIESSLKTLNDNLEEAGVLFPVAERLQVPEEEMTQWCLWAAEATERLKEFPVPKPSLNTGLLSKAQE